jgi:hypothetical protein
MASWKPKHRSCCVLLINYILRNKFLLDYKFVYFINYLCLFVTDIKVSLVILVCLIAIPGVTADLT